MIVESIPKQAKDKAELLSAIQNYLGNGGLFNPEMMEHDKVRDLILDCFDYIEASESRVPK